MKRENWALLAAVDMFKCARRPSIVVVQVFVLFYFGCVERRRQIVCLSIRLEFA